MTQALYAHMNNKIIKKKKKKKVLQSFLYYIDLSSKLKLGDHSSLESDKPSQFLL
jgi:hypothetical protein